MSPLSLSLRSAWDARVSDPGRFRRIVRTLLGLGIPEDRLFVMIVRGLAPEAESKELVRYFADIVNARTPEEVSHV